MKGLQHPGFPTRGFTLLELLIALSVLAILLAIGIPSFQTQLEKERITAATNDLLAAFQLGRSEAIRYGIPVTICSSNQQPHQAAKPVTCDKAPPYWSRGWLLFRDRDDSGQPPSDPQDILRIGSPLHSSLSVSTKADKIQFAASGNARLYGNLQIVSGAHQPRCVRVLPSGFTSSEKMPCP
jgi:type IV fimbrial biogenesis protein FimT